MHEHTPSAADTSLLSTHAATPPLTPMQADILDALRPAGVELLAKEIAVRTGHKYNSRLRTVLRTLLLRRMLQRGARGYRLPT